MDRKPKQPTLRIAIEGDGLGPSDVGIKQLAEFLDATAATLDAIAAEHNLPSPRPSLVAVRKGSAAYELTSDAPTWDPVVIDFYEAAKARGEGRPRAVRRGLERLFGVSSKLGAVRIAPAGTTDGIRRRPIHLAVPLGEVASSTSFGTTIHGRIVGVHESDRSFSVRIALAEGGRQDFETTEEVARSAARRFGEKVRATATGRWDGESVSGYAITDIEPWDDVDFLQALAEIRDELAHDGVEIDPDEWIAELDAE